MKKLVPAFLIALVSGFMFFLFEPINMYATNINDFWFDFFIMIKPSLIIFATYVLAIFAGYVILFLANIIFSKKLYLYKAFVIIGFIFLIGLYIQGNFLIAGLPPLDGTEIVWSEYKADAIKSIATFAATFVVTILLAYKFKFEKFAKIFSFISVAIFIMLSTSLVSTTLTHDTFKKKDKNLMATVKNINTASSDKNFYIFVADAVDSKIFNTVLEKSENKDTFNDFTYYPDTMSAYAYTRDSIPFIMSGIWNENETSFDEYSNNAYDNSKFIDELIKEKYSMNIYTDELIWNTDKALKVDNLANNMEMVDISYCRNILKYIAFKYLPYQLKQYSLIETMDFNNCRASIDVENPNYNYGNVFFKENILNEDELNKINEKYFGFIHIEGGHVPFDIDKNVDYIENGTYEQKLEGTITLITKFINRLKENGVYDNSVIIIMSDHGYAFWNYIGRQNAILFIKGIDEHHELERSDIPVSFEDLQGAYSELLNGSKSTDLFKNIESNRKRRYLLYVYETPDNMVEYEQTGTADNEDTLIPTGREFNR